jgi:hypothetical protein
MKKQYTFVVFLICFFVWAVVVDNAVIPKMDNLRQLTGSFTRYRVKELDKSGKLHLLKDELLIYARVKEREEFFYIERTPYFEATLKNLQPGDLLELRYSQAFPKVWKRSLYDVRVDGRSILRYSPQQLAEKQKFIWKFSGIIGGAFLLLAFIGMINKPRRR